MFRRIPVSANLLGNLALEFRGKTRGRFRYLAKSFSNDIFFAKNQFCPWISRFFRRRKEFDISFFWVGSQEFVFEFTGYGSQ